MPLQPFCSWQASPLTSSTAALVDIEPEQTKYTIEVLSQLMRYVLYEGNKTMAPLQKELDFIRHYVAFMRIHKSYIINLNHIAEININRVMLDNGKGFPIGESYREKLTDYVNRKFLGK